MTEPMSKEQQLLYDSTFCDAESLAFTQKCSEETYRKKPDAFSPEGRALHEALMTTFIEKGAASNYRTGDVTNAVVSFVSCVLTSGREPQHKAILVKCLEAMHPYFQLVAEIDGFAAILREAFNPDKNTPLN